MSRSEDAPAAGRAAIPHRDRPTGGCGPGDTTWRWSARARRRSRQREASRANRRAQGPGHQPRPPGRARRPVPGVTRLSSSSSWAPTNLTVAQLTGCGPRGPRDGARVLARATARMMVPSPGPGLLDGAVTDHRGPLRSAQRVAASRSSRAKSISDASVRTVETARPEGSGAGVVPAGWHRGQPVGQPGDMPWIRFRGYRGRLAQSIEQSVTQFQPVSAGQTHLDLGAIGLGGEAEQDRVEVMLSVPTTAALCFVLVPSDRAQRPA